MWSSDPATGPILLAVEAVPQSQAVVAAAAKLARQLRVEVLVLSVRERDYARGFAWDIHQPGEIAETLSRAIYEMVARAADARRRLPGLRRSDLPVIAVPTHAAPRRKRNTTPVSV
jgi:hypothetical protein